MCWTTITRFLESTKQYNYINHPATIFTIFYPKVTEGGVEIFKNFANKLFISKFTEYIFVYIRDIIKDENEWKKRNQAYL